MSASVVKELKSKRHFKEVFYSLDGLWKAKLKYQFLLLARLSR